MTWAQRHGGDGAARMRLLIAKLTNTTVQSVSVALAAAGDVADLATDLDSCVRMLRGARYDLVLLITSPHGPRARDAITRLRREVARLPLIVLTEPGAAPRDELVARTASTPSRPGIVLDPDGETLRSGGGMVGLSQAEARLFTRLWRASGEIVSAEDLLTAIYGEAVRPVSRVLPVFLFKLRKKLAVLGFDDVIETSIGRGFLLRRDAMEDARAREDA